MLLLLEILEDVTKLGLSVAALYVGLRLYMRRRRPTWHNRVDERRAAFLWLLSLGAIAVMVAEDALGGDSHLIDRHVLLFIREHVPAALTPWFGAVTVTASGFVLTPLTLVAGGALLAARRRGDAMLVTGSMVCGGVLILCTKMVVARDRPALWEAPGYWGSSFPSGHTLAMATFATAAALVAGRLRPAARVPALLLALAWVLLVGFSRLVLGVHWPTDVVVAACIGATIPLGLSFSLEHRRA